MKTVKVPGGMVVRWAGAGKVPPSLATSATSKRDIGKDMVVPCT